MLTDGGVKSRNFSGVDGAELEFGACLGGGGGEVAGGKFGVGSSFWLGFL